MGTTERKNMRIIFVLFSTGFSAILNKQQANSFLRSRRSSDQGSDCGSMPGAEEMCREEAEIFESADYNLSDNSFDPGAEQTVDYEQYSLDGQTNNFDADNSYESLMNY